MRRVEQITTISQIFPLFSNFLSWFLHFSSPRHIIRLESTIIQIKIAKGDKVQLHENKRQLELKLIQQVSKLDFEKKKTFWCLLFYQNADFELSKQNLSSWKNSSESPYKKIVRLLVYDCLGYLFLTCEPDLLKLAWIHYYHITIN